MIDVLKQSLEALETEVSIDWTNNDEINASAERMHEAITSLYQAIKVYESAPPEAQTEAEKTAYAFGWFKALEANHLRDATKLIEPVIDNAAAIRIATTLGWEPKREWVGLTKREFNECVDGLEDLEDCWTAIEAALREKNT